MSIEQNVLALLLDGPMQAWGASSRHGRRTTLTYPTRSGVIGLLCAAMGVERSDTGALKALADLSMETLVIRKRLEANRWTDFHTVGAAYDQETQRGFIPTTAEDGKPRGTVVTHREYLSDAAFGVLLTGDLELLGRCVRGLENPRWGVWLGRKCCIPADIIYQGMHATRITAIARLEERTAGTVVRLVREVNRFEDGTHTLLDVPLDFSVQDPSQRNQPRRVWEGAPEELMEGE
ncbi:MAG: type I-E CRISPR-associated protein Cas5/CasD [Candidatus Latescibacterota bacterium]|jgi:CRISPR system Cascade subunit CasD